MTSRSRPTNHRRVLERWTEIAVLATALCACRSEANEVAAKAALQNQDHASAKEFEPKPPSIAPAAPPIPTAPSVPTRRVNGLFKQVIAVGDATCGLYASGVVECWGDRGSELMSLSNRSLARIAASGAYRCGIDGQGRVACWGAEQPYAPPKELFEYLSLDADRACASAADGEMKCWGAARLTFSNDAPLRGVAAQGPCSLLESGVVICYGNRSRATPTWLRDVSVAAFSGDMTGASGRSGCVLTSEHKARCVNLPGSPPDENLYRISAGPEVACALTATLRARCWGNPDNRAVVAPDGSFTQISVGRAHACALARGGNIVCWGENSRGQLSPVDSATTSIGRKGRQSASLITALSTGVYERDSQGRTFFWPRQISKSMAERDLHRDVLGFFTQFDASSMCQCGIRSDGALDCFGDLDHLPTGTRFSRVAVGSHVLRTPDGPGESDLNKICHMCAIDVDGRLHCTGNNSAAQASPPAGRFKSVTASELFDCAIRVDDRLVCWGHGARRFPNAAYNAQKPKADDRFAEVTIGKYPFGFQTCGRHVDGTVECWPNRPLSYSYEIAQQPCPNDDACGAASPAGYKFAQISSGSRHNCGITTDGTIHCWGNNEYGQLNAPSGPFKQVVCGDDFSCGMRPDDSVECWGRSFSESDSGATETHP